MSQNVVKIFKLNFDGSFDEVAYENLKEVFTIVNILAIYVTTKKIMYIWIGLNASQALKNHISNIRVRVKEEFPDFRIIRNFTFEMRGESFDFFKNLDLDKEDLYKLIDYQEKVMLPTLKKIDNLKEAIEKLVDSEDYNNAIKNSEEIIKLAEKINDNALITEQKRFIAELTAKSAGKTIIDEIEKDAIEIDKEFSKLITSKEFLKAHKIVQEFENKNSEKYDLSAITSASDLISKEKKIWKKEQERLVKELTNLENNLFLAIKNLEIENAISLMDRGKSLFPNLVNDEIKKNWSKYEENLETAKGEADLVKIVESFISSSEEMKNNYQFSALEKKLNELLVKVTKLNITGYQKKLEELKAEIFSAELDYNKKLAEIDSLEKSISKKQKSSLIDEVVIDCKKIIKVAQAINRSKIIENYSVILENTEKAVEERKIFEEKQKKLEIELKKLEGEISSSLKIMDIAKLENIFEKSKILIVELVDEDIKKNWVTLEKKYDSAREIIEKVEKLSENSLNALDNKSYGESLKIYDQIIDQIKLYSK